MLATRYLRAPLRLFHSTAPRLQKQISQEESLQKLEDNILTPLVTEIEETPSTNREVPEEPREIFEAWKVNQFYTPLAFLRSRRIRPPSRPSYPTVGPGATEAAYTDVFRQLGIDPLKEANNSTLLSAFVTSMGKIHNRAQTGLSWRSQRKVAQAIKRAKQKGVIPTLHRAKYYVPKKVQ